MCLCCSHKTPFLSSPAVMHSSMQSQELYQLSQYIQVTKNIIGFKEGRVISAL